MGKLKEVEDLIIIGSGPAGYAAALKAKKYNPIIFEGEIVFGIPAGGQLMTTTHVDNYPGFPDGILGQELMKNIKQQAINEGIKIISRTVDKIEKSEENSEILLHIGKKIVKARAVIIATGSRSRRLYVKGTNDNELWQKGISSCAVCDGSIFGNKIVGVIGGGDTAMEEAQFLSNIAKKVYLIHRSENFRARKDCLEKIKNIKNIEFITNKKLIEARGDKKLSSIILADTVDNIEKELNVDGLFFAIGHDPNTFFFDNNIIKLDKQKYIIVNEKCETSLKGVFAAGDVADFEYRQAITAAGSGVYAAEYSIKYLEELKN